MQVTKIKYQANRSLPFEKVVVCQSSSGTRKSLSVTWISKEKLKVSFINKKQYIEIFKWENIALQDTGMLCSVGIT